MIEDSREPPENLIPSSPVDVPPWTCTDNGDKLQFWSDGVIIFETINTPDVASVVQTEVEGADGFFVYFWRETPEFWAKRLPYLPKIWQIRINERIREEENR